MMLAPALRLPAIRTSNLRMEDGQTLGARTASCIASSRRPWALAVNVKTEDAAFTLHHGRLRVDGSFITEVHLAAIVGGAKRKQVRRADCR